ncbi:cobalt-precorrin 5A hydrolase [Proteocatella sphenisci]|uniref:cobalt-precorrin 5A hydrolase n=1 Tax=Proteocatella sphenisci TaxID=181070 RepID=UPI0006886A66|nr:cobalamin biosynthesis protein [Proteocatella sphenisci]
MKRESGRKSIYVMAFTINGAELAARMRDVFSQWKNIDAKFFVTKRLTGGSPASLGEFTSQAFAEADHIIYIGAAGIAVRAIAPHLKSKDTDPGVIVIDEHAKHIIPILSGHIGGSNELAIKLAEVLGADPVITTATDINDVISIDSWAVENSMKIDSIKNIKHISSAVLENRKIKVYTDCRGNFAKLKTEELLSLYSGFELADSLDSSYPTVVITDAHSLVEKVKIRFPEALVLIPTATFIGMGCRKDIDEVLVNELFEQAISELDLDIRAVGSINTADIKKDEKALLALVQKHDFAFNTFSAEELMEADKHTSSEMSHSELVSRTVGAGNVCERAAVMGAFGSPAYSGAEGIEIIMKKMKRSGVTIAVSCI